MTNTALQEVKTKVDAAWANLARQLRGMEPYLERSDAPGEWTTREVLAHLMFEDGWNPVDVLKRFGERDLPLVEIEPGRMVLTPARRAMTLGQLVDALDGQRRSVLAYLEALPEGDLQSRKARIPLFKRFMATDEIPIAVFVGGLFGAHWGDHAGQLAKIRKAVGLPEST